MSTKNLPASREFVNGALHPRAELAVDLLILR